MAIQADLTELERFLLTTPNDTEDAPWMVMSDLQVRDVELLRTILRLHIQRQRLPWYVASYLKMVVPRPNGEPLEAAPDLLLAEAEDRLRTSWTVRDEGKPPALVLEVAAPSSWKRDTEEKPRIYERMGVPEYAIFLPERRDGPALFGYRRDDGGRWQPWQTDKQGVLWCRALGGIGLFVEDRLWLRALDAQGARLPTPWEVAEAAQATAEAAQAEVVRLREELRQQRGGQG